MVVVGGGGCIGQRPILLLLRAKIEIEIEIELRASQSLSITLKYSSNRIVIIKGCF